MLVVFVAREITRSYKMSPLPRKWDQGKIKGRRGNKKLQKTEARWKVGGEQK
jgi:hypothetical protein